MTGPSQSFPVQYSPLYLWWRNKSTSNLREADKMQPEKQELRPCLHLHKRHQSEEFSRGRRSSVLPPFLLAVYSLKRRQKEEEEEEDRQLYNRLMWKEVKNVSIAGLTELAWVPEGSRMDSPSFPLSLSVPIIQLFALARDIISSPFT